MGFHIWWINGWWMRFIRGGWGLLGVDGVLMQSECGFIISGCGLSRVDVVF